MVPGFIGREMTLASRGPIVTALRTSAVDYSSSVMIGHGIVKCGSCKALLPRTWGFFFPSYKQTYVYFSTSVVSCSGLPSRTALQTLSKIRSPQCVHSLQVTDTMKIPTGSVCIRVKQRVFSYGVWRKQAARWPDCHLTDTSWLPPAAQFMTNTRKSSVICL